MDLKETTDKVIKYKLKYSAQELEGKLDKVDQEYSLEEKEKLNGLKNYDDSQIKSDVNTLTENKLDKNQGTENSGKVLGTNANGEVIPLNGYGFEYNEETGMLEYGTDPTSNLNQGIGLDDTLSKKGYAADAGAVGELKEDIDNIYSKYLSIKDEFENVEWLCGYSFYADSPYVHTDDRYFVNKNAISVKKGTTITNPDTSKYLYAIGFYDKNNENYIAGKDNYENLEKYTFENDAYIRIAFKKQDNSTMTQMEMENIIHLFLYDTKFELLPEEYEETIITVGLNADFADLKSALDSISDNAKEKPYFVKILEGIYDLPSSEYNFGLKNYVRIVGEDKYKCIVRNIYSDSIYDSGRNTFDVSHYNQDIEYASIENLTVICKGGKAPIHIDSENHVGTIEIKNCILYDMNTLDMTNIPIRSNNYNAGGINVGLLGGRSVKVYDTVSNGTIYAHNQSNQSKPCYFEVNHCQFVSTMWGDLGSGQEDTAVFNDCHFNDLYFGCSSSLTSTKVKTVLKNNDIKTVTSYGSDWTDGNGFAGWSQVFGGKCEVIENNIHKQVFNKSTSKITAGSLVQLVNIRGVNLNGLHVEEYNGGLLFGYAMEDIEPNSFGLVQYRNDVEIPLIDGISVGDEIEYTNGTYQKKTTGKTVGYYLGSAPYYRYKMRLNH